MSNAQIWYVLIAGTVVLITAILAFASAIGSDQYEDEDAPVKSAPVATVVTADPDPGDAGNYLGWRSR